MKTTTIEGVFTHSYKGCTIVINEITRKYNYILPSGNIVCGILAGSIFMAVGEALAQFESTVDRLI